MKASRILREFCVMCLSRLISLLCLSMCIGHVQCSPVTNHGNEVFGDLYADAINYARDNPETLEAILAFDKAIVEGDIIMPSNRNAVDAVWPAVNGKVSVAFVIHPDLVDMTDSMLKAMEILSENACVSFHKRSTEPDYIHFYPSKGCASYVGYQGGEQKLYVGPMCNVGNIAHEILHALGFHHEHTRLDRNEHIEVIENNIQKGKRSNFKMKDGKTFGIPYDTSSIMHYGRQYFSKNGLPTIKLLKHSSDMGQRTHLTPHDMKRIRVLYQCAGTGEMDDKLSKEKEDTFLKMFDRLKKLYLDVPGVSADFNTYQPVG
ncbi:astacin-like metalloendopeptidase isoform X2 [Gadus macrocephalus]|uniref:astacin-like metalloendopeptidase isoform X2 n=1 Tax=Gadus macrocephalus TaxID=80720 RepID=UPI0028CBB7C3|nr:astacin-like metalloendopeptidase isoform X2 [Gadus macrocephalus]